MTDVSARDCSSTIEPHANIIALPTELAQTFRRHKQPVVLVNVTGRASTRAEQSRALDDLTADFDEIVTELQVQPQDHRVTKRTWGAFTDTTWNHTYAARTSLGRYRRHRIDGRDSCTTLKRAAQSHPRGSRRSIGLFSRK